ncbi:MAG: hypothetical protein ACR2FN_06075 [Chitinophagaceae bacterium]
MKQYNYVITIKQPDFKSINSISQLMLFFAVAVFIYIALQDKNMFVFNLIISAVIISWTGYCIVLSKKENYIVYYRLVLLLAAVGWFFQPYRNIFFAILYTIAAIIEKQVKFPAEIGVDEEGIIFNSFQKKFHSWDEISNLIIRDGIITVDYKNNKLFQKEIESKITPSLEKEFNEFCSSRIFNLNKSVL